MQIVTYKNKIVRFVKFTLQVGACASLLGCGPQNSRIEQSFQDYVNRFVSAIGVRPDFPMQFTDSVSYVGVCITYSTGNREVLIDKTFWDKASDSGREQLIFHELGHCVLGRGHQKTTKWNWEFFTNVPISIMYPYVFGGRPYYDRYKDEYIKELPIGSDSD